MSLAEADPSTSLDAALAAVFPLPLTPIEAFMAIDARPGYPLAVDMELSLRGRIERAAFESAFATAVARNPLLNCRIEGRGPFAWVPCETKPSIEWIAEGGELGDRYEAFVDLWTEAGLRVWVRQGDDRARVLLHYHHACCDGMGGFSFVEDLLAAYATAVGGGESSVEPRPIDPARLVNRGQASVPYRTPWQLVGDSFVGLWDGLKLLFARPLPLASVATPADETAAPLQHPRFVTISCSPDVKAGLRRAAGDAGATTNDILLRDLFVVLRRWNDAHQGSAGRRRLRILMPQNLREPADASAPAANILSFAFLTRRASACDRPAELLASIRDETARIKRDKLSLYFLMTVGGALIAGFLPRVLKSKVCFSTVVLSNLSYPMRRFVAKFPRAGEEVVAGNLVLESIAAVPPPRPQTHAAFGVVSTDQALSITCKWDPSWLSRADAERLLNDYHAQLRSTAAAADAAT